MHIVHTDSPRGRRVRLILLLLLIPAVTALLFGSGRLFLKAAYPIRYEDAVQKSAQEYDVPASLVYAVIRVESGFDSGAVSHAGAQGLMQITGDTLIWSRYRLHLDTDGIDLFDPATNIQTGTHVLSLLCEQYDSIETVLAAYNAGIGTVSQWLADPELSEDGETLRRIPYGETEDYVRRVLSSKRMYEYLYTI